MACGSHNYCTHSHVRAPSTTDPHKTRFDSRNKSDRKHHHNRRAGRVTDRRESLHGFSYRPTKKLDDSVVYDRRKGVKHLKQGDYHRTGLRLLLSTGHWRRTMKAKDLFVG